MEIESIKQKVLEDVDPVMKKKKAKERRKQRLIVIMQFLLVFVVIIGLFHFFIGISTVDGESMYPTLHDKNVVIYERHNSEYKAGDIVALDMPNGDVYVKRVIAVAGDTVNIDREKIYVNGEEVTTPQAVGKTEAKSDKITYPLTVEDKQVFVLGDNREISRDSREIGTVKIKNIKGKIRWSIGIF